MKQALQSWRRAVFAPLAILALAIQCLVIQTHIDLSAPRHEAAAVSAPASGDRSDAAAPGAACAVCQASLSGALALGDAPALVVDRLARYAAATQIAPAVMQRVRSHAWRSRAPPRH